MVPRRTDLMRTDLIQMRSDSPPLYDDVKKGERLLRDFWGYYVFLYFGLCFHVFRVCGHVYFVAYGHVFYILMLVDLFV